MTTRPPAKDGPTAPATDRSTPVSPSATPQACLHCHGPLDQKAAWCRSCTAQGRAASTASLARQVAAGMPAGRNWKPGDPHWWRASGCYR